MNHNTELRAGLVCSGGHGIWFWVFVSEKHRGSCGSEIRDKEGREEQRKGGREEGREWGSLKETEGERGKKQTEGVWSILHIWGTRNRSQLRQNWPYDVFKCPYMEISHCSLSILPILVMNFLSIWHFCLLVPGVIKGRAQLLDKSLIPDCARKEQELKEGVFKYGEQAASPEACIFSPGLFLSSSVILGKSSFYGLISFI